MQFKINFDKPKGKQEPTWDEKMTAKFEAEKSTIKVPDKVRNGWENDDRLDQYTTKN